MDARRFDRHADLLSQIYWHLTKMQLTHHERAESVRVAYMNLIEAALKWNDELGQLAEQGLI